MIVADNRMRRPVLPKDECPFCPGVGKTPSDYDVYVYQNDYPSMSLQADSSSWEEASVAPDEGLVSRPSYGACEIILYSPDHNARLFDLADWHIAKLINCWRERVAELGSLAGIRYVFIFENRGEAVGVTIHHPHGQIYALPFVPRKIACEIEACRSYAKRRSSCLFCDMLRAEVEAGTRIVAANEDFACLIPYFARFPFEAHVISRRHLQTITQLSDSEALAFGRILQRLVAGYDSLFGFPLPYIMAFHQAPTDGGNYDDYHFHVEFYPPHCDAATLKYLSGTEIGIDVFVNPSDIEANAERLRLAVQRAGG